MRLEKIFHDELRTPACSSRLQMQIKTNAETHAQQAENAKNAALPANAS
jgi:hypothetical protein